MKKIGVLLVLIGILFSCSACAEKERAAKENEILLEIDLSEIQDAFYTMGIEYALDNQFMGAQETGYADGAAYKEKNVCFTLVRGEELPNDRAPEALSFVFMISNVPGGSGGINELANRENMAWAEPCDPFDAEYGNIYRFRATGSFEKGFTIEKAE